MVKGGCGSVGHGYGEGGCKKLRRAVVAQSPDRPATTGHPSESAFLLAEGRPLRYPLVDTPLSADSSAAGWVSLCEAYERVSAGK